MLEWVLPNFIIALYAIYAARRLNVATRTRPSRAGWSKRTEPTPSNLQFAAPGSDALRLLYYSLFIWSGAQVLSAIAPNPDLAVFFSKTLYIGVVVGPAAWLMVAYTVGRRTASIPRPLLAAVCFMPALTIVILFTNEWHHWFWVDREVVVNGSVSVIKPVRGFWFTIHTVYSYAAVLAATAILVFTLSNSSQYKTAMISAIAAPFVVVILNAVFLSSLNEASLYDYTCVGFAAAVSIIDRGIVRTGMFQSFSVLRERVVENLSEPFLVVTADRTIVDANKAASSVLAAPGQRLIGDSLDEWIHIPDPAALSKTNRLLEIPVDNRSYEIAVSTLQRDSGNLTYSVLLRDVTERAQAKNDLLNAKIELERLTDQLQSSNTNLESQVEARTRDLSLAKEQAEAANEAKSRFLANMSHELRTPLNGVLGMGELLSEMTMGERQREMLATMVDSGRSLLNIVNDVLDLAKIQAGEMHVEKQAFELRDLVEKTVANFHGMAHQGGLALQIEFQPQDDVRVFSDPVRLRQILSNLINNAIKFTQEGSITVRVDVSQSEEAPLWRFDVVDTGVGIPEESLQDIFNAFSQVDDSSKRRYAGTGLGLAICQELTDLLDGALEVHSEFGVGSTFSVILPMRPVATPGAASLPKDCSVLLVESEPVSRRIVTAMLTKLGASATVAPDESSAAELLAQHAFDAVLVGLENVGPGALRQAARAATPERRTTFIAIVDADTQTESPPAFGFDSTLARPLCAASLMAVLSKPDDVNNAISMRG